MWLEVAIRNINYKKLLGFIEIYTRDISLGQKKAIGEIYKFNYEEQLGRPNLAPPASHEGISLNITLEQQNEDLMLCLTISLKKIVYPNSLTYNKVNNLFKSVGNEEEYLSSFFTDFAQEDDSRNQDVALQTRVELGKLKTDLRSRQRLAISKISAGWSDCAIINEDKRFKVITNTEKELTFLPEPAYEKSLRHIVENSHRTKLSNEVVFLTKDPRLSDAERRDKWNKIQE